MAQHLYIETGQDRTVNHMDRR